MLKFRKTSSKHLEKYLDGDLELKDFEQQEEKYKSNFLGSFLALAKAQKTFEAQPQQAQAQAD